MIPARHCLVLTALLSSCWGQENGEAPPVIDQAKELHYLTRAEVLLPRQVKIKGIITYKRGDEFNDFAMQDESGGFIADLQTPLPMTRSLQPGQEIEIEGFTVIDPPPVPRVSVIRMGPGEIVGLPAPQVLTPQALLGGAGLFTYVEFSGVIRSTRIETDLLPQRLVLDFGPPDQGLSVRIARYDEHAIARLKPDTRVRVRGTALAWTSVTLQPYSVFIGVHDEKQVDVLSEARQPEEIERTDLGTFASSHQEGFDARREKVRGVVTLRWPGEMVVIQGEGGAVRAIPADVANVRIGDEVDVTGFSSAAVGRVYLDQAVFTSAVPSKLPEPETIDALSLKHQEGRKDREAHLVRVSGMLREITRRENHPLLRLESDGMMFDAILQEGVSLPEDLRPGSELEITGVCHYLVGQTARRIAIQLDGFELQLADLSGIRILSAPPWWTPGRLVAVMSVILVILGLSLLWVVALRRRVAVRSAMLVREIRARHDTQLLVSERSRLAADLHDTLSQTLSGAALQMEIADSVEGGSAETHRALAKRLIDRSREDLRRAVWDLTPSVLLNQDLEAAFRAIAHEVTSEHHGEIVIDAEPSLPTLPERTRSHLLRTGQEAIHNALRHGKAARVVVSLRRSGEGIHLRVEDNGSGFDPSQAPGPVEGHFGLGSMRNRIQRLGGKFTIQSSPRGTAVTAEVPATSSNDPT